MIKFTTAIICALLVGSADAHGFLSKPASRNAVEWMNQQDYCPHCLAGGGVSGVSGHVPTFPAALPENPNTAFRHGLCGDASSGNGVSDQKFLNLAPSIQGIYTSGGAIDIEIQITANHAGLHEFYLCDQPAEMLKSAADGQKCLNKYPLKRAAPGPQNTPINSASAGTWYMPDDASDGDVSDGAATDQARWSASSQQQVTTAPRSTEQRDQGQHAGAQIMKLKYWLPEGVSCEHCVLQWYWRTANSCNPEGYESGGFLRTTKPEWARAEGMGACGSAGVAYPEEFWNCADIKVVGGGGSSPDSPDQDPADQVQVEEPVPEPEPEPTPPADPSTPAPTAAPTSASTGGTCQSAWGQCGGKNHQGPSCCVSGYSCVYSTEWYSQCKPASASTPAAPAPPADTANPADPAGPAAPAAPASTDGTCQSAWGQCGGKNHQGPSCCVSGHTCVYSSDWYSQCKPSRRSLRGA